MPRQRQHRRLVRQRHYLRRRITSVKNRLGHLLADYNADRRDLFSNEGRRAAAKAELLPADRFTLEMLFKELEFHNEQLIAVEREIKAFGKKAPQREAEARRVLATIPGVGPVTIEAFLAEVGDGVQTAPPGSAAPVQSVAAARRVRPSRSAPTPARHTWETSAPARRGHAPSCSAGSARNPTGRAAATQPANRRRRACQSGHPWPCS